MTGIDARRSTSATSLGATVVMDDEGRIRIPRGGAVSAALLRIGLGWLYVWGFVSQALGVGYTNDGDTWHFSFSTDAGWITSGFKTSPTEGYIGSAAGGWLNDTLLDGLPTGIEDTLWIFAMGGLGLALTLGIFSRIAGWGGLALNLIVWFATFPPENNPVLDGEHFAFGFGILLVMWLQASNYWGFGRWWRARTPAILH